MNSSFVYENIRMETPLRERSGGHAGAAPTVSFGRLRVDDWFRLGGLHVNGYFVCVGCVEKYGGVW